MGKISKQDKLVANPGIDKKQKAEDKDLLVLSLLQRTEQKVENKFSDKNLDRQNEIIELLNGSTIDLLEREKTWVADFAKALQEYAPIFPQEFYMEIFRLKKWDIPEGKIKNKPWVVARYTNQIIYGRFSKEVLMMLQDLNPYVSFGKRQHKHFQWFNPMGKTKVEAYIQDAISVMKSHTKWYEFRVAHAIQFGVTFQLEMFDDEGELLY